MIIKKQVKTFGPRTDAKLVKDYGKGAQLTAKVRHDDSCNNGYNSFAITADVVTTASKRRKDIEAGGSLHEDIARLFPELAPLIKWHRTSTDGPVHYIENTMYWLGYRGYCNGKQDSPPNLEYARKSAVWPDMPEEYVSRHESKAAREADGAVIEARLRARLAALLTEFRAGVESLGMEY